MTATSNVELGHNDEMIDAGIARAEMMTARTFRMNTMTTMVAKSAPTSAFGGIIAFNRTLDAAGHLCGAFVGTTAAQVRREIAPYVQNSDHAMYLGAELVKAEACLRSGKFYTQDDGVESWLKTLTASSCATSSADSCETA